MTTGALNTSLVKIFIGATPVAITCIVDATVSVSMAPRNITCHDSGDYEDYLSGPISWEMSGTGIFAYDAANGYDTLFTAIKAKAKLTVAWGTAVGGDFKYGGQALLTKLDGNASGNNANTQFSFSMMGVGEPAKTVNA